MYQSIADYYDELFPLKENRFSFVSSLFGKEPVNFLDIGCATGELVLALCRKGHRGVGLDLDARMVERAQAKGVETSLDVRFLAEDMLKTQTLFPAASFDAVTCFGNTLVHLDGLESMGQFFSGISRVLVEGGRLVLQVVNYRRILSQNIQELPLLENPLFCFKRKYKFDKDAHRMFFTTHLTIKKDGNVFNGTETLYPLIDDQLHQLLTASGFDQVTLYGNEDGAPYHPDSPGVIAVARKM